DELEMYKRLYDVLSDKVRWPDLVIYLRANTATLMARIAMRDRTYEREMDQDYIETLRQSYESLFRDYADTPLLVIESDAMDFVRNPEDLSVIENRIDAALAGIHQPALPDIQTQPLQRTARIPPKEKMTIPPQLKPDPQANWKTLENYLHLTEAIGRIGGTLPRNLAPEQIVPTDELQQAIQDAAYALKALAQHTGVDLRTNSPGKLG
ncbi:MAG: deoxynucleoside kinase, partial [Anaerolineae bacterium]|nr:deoxynucleoside kinase [Anaerolineae bacterium]